MYRRFRLYAGPRLQLPACRWAWGLHVDSISHPASGLSQDVPAPIRARALRPEPIVSRSRGGSGRLLPGVPELPEPSALCCLPADLPTRPPSRSCWPGNSPTVAAVPGLALSSLLTIGLGRWRQQRGRQRPSREEAAAAGPVMGLGVRGGGCCLVLSRDRPSGGCGGVVSPEPRGWRGQKSERLGRERSGGGEPRRRWKGKIRERRGSDRLGDRGPGLRGQLGETDGRLGSRHDCG